MSKDQIIGEFRFGRNTIRADRTGRFNVSLVCGNPSVSSEWVFDWVRSRVWMHYLQNGIR